jgi:hypothetical protein
MIDFFLYGPIPFPKNIFWDLSMYFDEAEFFSFWRIAVIGSFVLKNVGYLSENSQLFA